MAEIRVEPRQKSRGWLWVVLLLIVIGAVLYYLYASGMLAGSGATAPAASTTPPTPTSVMEAPPLSIASASAILTSSLSGGTHGSTS